MSREDRMHPSVEEAFREWLKGTPSDIQPAPDGGYLIPERMDVWRPRMGIFPFLARCMTRVLFGLAHWSGDAARSLQEFGNRLETVNPYQEILDSVQRHRR